MKEIGICGSDLHYFNEGRIGDHVVTAPHILGHEAAGVIAEVGRSVRGFRKGDRVSIEPGVPQAGSTRRPGCPTGSPSAALDRRLRLPTTLRSTS